MLGANSAGSKFVRMWKTPTVAGTILGTSFGAGLATITKSKGAYAFFDFSMYGLGVALCR